MLEKTDSYQVTSCIYFYFIFSCTFPFTKAHCRKGSCWPWANIIQT